MAGEEVYTRAQAGDPAALALFEEFGAELGYAVLLALFAYDPELIVLGGSISVALPLFGDRMRERLREYPWPHVVARAENRRRRGSGRRDPRGRGALSRRPQSRLAHERCALIAASR